MDQFERISRLEARIKALESIVNKGSLDDELSSFENQAVVHDFEVPIIPEVATVSEQAVKLPEEFVKDEILVNQSLNDVSSNQTNESSFDLVDVYFEKAISYIKTNFLALLGSVMVILSMAWLVRFSFLQGWIGEVGRVVIGYSFAAVMLLLGNKYLVKKKVFSILALIISFATILITTYVAQIHYELFNPYAGLSIMILATLVNFAIAYSRRILTLAVLSLLAGVSAPFLANLQDSPTLVLLYSLILVVLSIVVSYKRDWSGLAMLSLVAGALIPIWTNNSSDLVLLYSLVLVVISVLVSYKKNWSALPIIGLVSGLTGLWLVDSSAEITLAYSVLLVLIGIYVSVKQDMKYLGALSLIVGATIPGWTAMFSSPSIVLIYALVLVLLSNLLSVRLDWPILRLFSLIVGFTYYGSALISFEGLLVPTLMAISMIVAYLVTVSYQYRNRIALDSLDYVSFMASVSLIFYFIFTLQDEYLYSLTMVAVSLVAILSSYIIRLFKVSPDLVKAFAVQSILFFSVGILFEVPTDYIPLTLLIQWVMISFVAKNWLESRNLMYAVNFMWLYPIIVLVANFGTSYSSMKVFEVITFVAAIGSFLVMRSLYKDEDEREYSEFYLFLATLVAALFLWTINRDLFATTALSNSRSIANGVTLVQLTVIGMLLYVLHIRYPITKYLGYLLVGIVIVRLLFVEMWLMDLVPRVITFLLIGLMFVASAFFDKKYNLKK